MGNIENQDGDRLNYGVNYSFIDSETGESFSAYIDEAGVSVFHAEHENYAVYYKKLDNALSFIQPLEGIKPEMSMLE